MRRNSYKRKRIKWLPVISSVLLLSTSILLPKAIKRIERKIPFKVKELQVLGGNSFKIPNLSEWLSVKEGDPVYGNWVGKSIDKLKENPRVEQAIVARSMTGEVMVKIGERKDEALVNLKTLHFIDKEAHILGPVDSDSRKNVADLVTLTGPWGEKGTIRGYENQLREGMMIKNILVESGIPEPKISEIHWDPKYGFDFFYVGLPARISLGKVNFEKKGVRLKRVLKDFYGKERSIREIDVDFDDRVVVKLSGVVG
jgi:hypothetical protein